MNIKNLRKCLNICKKKYETEYSGNVNLKNIRKISNTKINRISVGCLTHSAEAFDSNLDLNYLEFNLAAAQVLQQNPKR